MFILIFMDGLVLESEDFESNKESRDKPSEPSPFVNVLQLFCCLTFHCKSKHISKLIGGCGLVVGFVPYMAFYAKPVPPRVFNPVPCEEYE